MEQDQRLFLGCALGLFGIIIILMTWSFIYDARHKFLSGTETSLEEPSELPKPTLPPQRATDPVAGSNDPKAVTITIFSDFSCPRCRLSEGEMIRAITEAKRPVRVVWRDLPLSSTSRETMLNALAGRCAHAQKKFWDLHDALLSLKTVNEPGIREQASKLGMEMNTFTSCLEQGTYLQAIQKDVALAREHLITTPPTFFVGKQPAVSGYVSANQFKKLIQQASNTP